MNFSEFPLLYDADIVVVGAGPAGFAAAVAAARSGEKVVLLEQTSMLGGMSTAGLVPMWCPSSNGKRMVYEGIFREVNEAMCERMGEKPWTPPHRWQPIDPEMLKAVYDHMAAEAGVQVIFDVKLCAARTEKDLVVEVLAATGNGLKRISGRMFIDGTGNGQLAMHCGADYEVGDENNVTMSPTLCGRFSNVNCTEERVAFENGVAASELWAQALKDGTNTVEERHFVCMKPTSAHSASSNLGHIYGADTLDEFDVSRSYTEGRNILWKFLKFFRERVPGYQNAELVGSATLLGVRETRRVACDYKLTYDTFLKRESFQDEIGQCSYGIDIHASTTDKKEQSEVNPKYHGSRLAEGESYGIPYRSLVVKKFRNLLVAGRAIGCDRKMQGSIRVMPACFVTGQAAGLAAHLALPLMDLRKIDVKELQKEIAAL